MLHIFMAQDGFKPTDDKDFITAPQFPLSMHCRSNDMSLDTVTLENAF